MKTAARLNSSITKINIWIKTTFTFFLTSVSAWPINLMMALKYAEGIMTLVMFPKTTCICSFNSCLMPIGTIFLFFLESTSCKQETTCSISAPSVLCKANINLAKNYELQMETVQSMMNYDLTSTGKYGENRFVV